MSIRHQVGGGLTLDNQLSERVLVTFNRHPSQELKPHVMMRRTTNIFAEPVEKQQPTVKTDCLVPFSLAFETPLIRKMSSAQGTRD